MNYTEDPVKLLQKLIQFNTTNPPGNEKACIYFIKDLLKLHGIESTIYAKDKNRPNLIAKLENKAVNKHLLWYGHVDVVPAHTEKWTKHPFKGDIIDGNIYGRGALDMKGPVSILISAFIELSKKEIDFNLTLAIVSDEENAGEFGAEFLVNQHPELFKDIKYAYGEFGGTPLWINDEKIYFIQMAEKEVCWLKIKLQGNGGHASVGQKNSMFKQLAAIINNLNEHKFPLHSTPFSKKTLHELSVVLSQESPLENNEFNLKKLETFLTNLGKFKPIFDSILRNTVNITKINSGLKTNVIPKEVVIELDGRILPGFSTAIFIKELNNILKQDNIEIEIINYIPSNNEHPNLDLYPILKETLTEADPNSKVIPICLPASTDARHFNKLGIQTYGFIPMDLSKEIDLFQKVHGIDEYVNVDALYFGVETILKSIEKFIALKI